MRDYKKRIMVTIKPKADLVLYGNKFNDYKTLAVRGGDGTAVRGKNVDARLIQVNNLGALENADAMLMEIIDNLLGQGKQDSELFNVIADMKAEVEIAMNNFVK